MWFELKQIKFMKSYKDVAGFKIWHYLENIDPYFMEDFLNILSSDFEYYFGLDQIDMYKAYIKIEDMNKVMELSSLLMFNSHYCLFILDDTIGVNLNVV